MKPPLKDRLQQGEVCTGTFLLFFFGGDVVQFFAGLGLDFLILDMEHSALDFARARDTIVVARGCGIAPLARVAEAQYTQVARALDAGAEGIVLPRVESPAQARELVRCGRFPPEGERGLTTFAGHNDFTGVADVGRFAAERNRNILLFVQIETRAGLENRDAILSDIIPWLELRDIYSRGRFGMWKYEVANTDHALMQGVELVNRLLLGEQETTIGIVYQATEDGREAAVHERPGHAGSGEKRLIGQAIEAKEPSAAVRG